MVIQMVGWQHFSEDITVKVVLMQKNQLEMTTMDKAFLSIYSGLVTHTIESRPLAHIHSVIQVK